MEHCCVRGHALGRHAFAHPSNACYRQHTQTPWLNHNYAPQVARQILEEPNSLVNQVTFKPLGFLNGESRQYGTISPISGDTFQVGV